MRQAAERFTSTLGAIPLIADADTGFGDVTHVYRTIGEYERAGVSAIQLEDQAFPKRCGHLAGKEVIPAEDFVLKLRAAQEARTDENFLIIARTDAIAPLGFEEAMRRAKLYEEAGADILFIEAPQTLDQIKMIPGSFGIPCLFNDVPRGHTPSIEHAVIGDYGYRIVIAPAACMGAAAVAIEESLRALQQSGGTGAGPHQLSPKELFDVLGLEFWQDLSQRYDAKADGKAAAAQKVSE